MRSFARWPARPTAPKTFAVLAGITVILAGPALCQGVESYAFVHPFGLSTATTTRQFGMGGPISCVLDLGSGNPAFSALYEQPAAALRLSSTDFDRGPRLLSTHAYYITPLAAKRRKPTDHRGLTVSLFSLQASSGQVPLPQVGPTTVDMSEEDIAVHYGQRLSKRLTAGLGVSLHSEITFTLGVAGGPTLLDVEAKPDIGARLGLTYEWQPGDFAGLVYDFYQETARAAGLLVGGNTERVFHTDLLALGVTYHPRPNWLVVAEYQRGSSFSGPVDNALSGWHVGAEYQPVKGLAVRAGLNDERLTLGLGYEDEDWQVGYAYMNRWNDNIASGFFGGSDTHQLQATYRW